MLKKLFGYLVAFFCGTSAQAAEEPLKVLFIGNSYTHMNDMPSIFEKISSKSGKHILVEKNTQSGASFKVHSQRLDMYEAINRRKWDYVILQGYSRELSFPKEHIDTATVPYLKKITDSIYSNNPCTNVMFYMTWGYDNGFLEREEVNTYEKMADSIRVGYKYIGDVFNAPVVPVGMVWKEVRQNTRINLYANDRAHPSRNGSYLIASTFYGAIFNEPIGKKVFTSTVKRRFAKQIKKEMFDYIANHREEYNLDKNRFEIIAYTNDNGEYVLDFIGHFPDATGITWEFGDGTTFQDMNGRHIYEKDGTYLVIIKVKDQCGLRTYHKQIKFEPIITPRRRREKR
jgi:hypothetical protein